MWRALKTSKNWHIINCRDRAPIFGLALEGDRRVVLVIPQSPNAEEIRVNTPGTERCRGSCREVLRTLYPPFVEGKAAIGARDSTGRKTADTAGDTASYKPCAVADTADSGAPTAKGGLMGIEATRFPMSSTRRRGVGCGAK